MNDSFDDVVKLVTKTKTRHQLNILLLLLLVREQQEKYNNKKTTTRQIHGIIILTEKK